MPKPSFVAFAGSARKESLNRKLLAVAVKAVREAGGETTAVELGDLNLPLYHGDLEENAGIPEAAKKLIELGRSHTGYLIVTPEYNASIPPLLKNAIDWMSRSDDDPFEGKVVAVMSASPGAFGAVKSASQIRSILQHLGCHVLPGECSLGKAHEAFDASGGLKEARSQALVAKTAAALVGLGASLAAK